MQRMHDSFLNLCQVFCVINLTFVYLRKNRKMIISSDIKNIIQSFPEGRVFSISDFAIDPQYDMALAKLLSRMSAKGEIQKIRDIDIIIEVTVESYWQELLKKCIWV